MKTKIYFSLLCKASSAVTCSGKRLRQLLAVLLLSMIGLGGTSCGHDDSIEPAEPSGEVPVTISDQDATLVRDLKGAIHYDDQMGRWYIEVIEENSIDVVNYYYPIDLLEDFKVEKLQVSFSGKVLLMENPPAAPAGYTFYFVKITNITKL